MNELNNSNIKCEICGKEFKNFKGLSSHIWQIHEIRREEYYLKYIGIKGTCIECGKDTRFNNLRDGYSKFCGLKCSNNNIDVRNKCIQTCMENNGVNYPLQSEKIRKRQIETCLERYDCENPLQNKEVQKKTIETCKKRYNVSHYSKTLEFKNKYTKTCKKRYGYTHAMKNRDIKNKFCNSILKKYNVKHPSQSTIIQDKKKNTCLKNLGVEYTFQSSKVREKTKETNMERYGVENYTQSDEYKKSSRLTYQQCLERYPDLVIIEGLIEGPNGEILGHCKNSSCKNSKENSGYFEVTAQQILWRNKGINGHDTDNFYCCEECKHSCPLYGKSASALHNLINENPEIPYTESEYSTWKEEVYHRQRIENNTDINFCEYCGVTENLHVHHEVPQKIVPGYSLDPDNGIIACEKCHYEKGHAAGTVCSTGNLANKICK